MQQQPLADLREVRVVLDSLAAVQMHFIAPGDPTWTHSDPTWIRLYDVMEKDLRHDVLPALCARMTGDAQRWLNVAAVQLTVAQAQALLDYFHSPEGRRHMQLQEELGLIQAEAVAVGTVDKLAGSIGIESIQRTVSPSIWAQRMSFLKLSWAYQSVGTMVDGMTRQGVSGAGGEFDDLLRAAAAGFGPEIDSLQSAYSQDMSRFEVFRASPAFVALMSVYRTLTTQAISRATGGPSPLAAAVHQAKAVHEAEWRRLYEGSRAGRSSAEIPGNTEPMTAESVPPEIQGLPNEPGVILETHDAVVDVVRISNGDTSRLALPAELSVYPAGVPAQRCPLTAASWAPKARKLLIGWRGHVALIDREGAVRDLHLTMPGALKPLTGMCDFIVSPDASLVAYTINTSQIRDLGEGPYVGVMYQSAAGSVPKSISKSVSEALSVPDWSPDNLKLAYGDSNGELAAADIAGKKLWSIHLADGGVKSDYGPSDLELRVPQLRSAVSEIRWAPDGHSLGALIGLPARLYRFRSDGTPQGEVHFAERDMTVDRFAWSPSGKQIVFRSGYGGFQCTGTLSFKDKDIHGLAPCRAGSDLFISNSDGSDVKRLSKQTNSTMGTSQLFWIQ